MRPVVPPVACGAEWLETFPNLREYWGKILWMLRIGEARHPGPRSPPSKHFSIECVNIGGWLSNGDCASESPADFLAVVEHRLIPAPARSITRSLRVTAGVVSIWAPACHDSIPGGHAGVGVVSLKGAPLTLPTFNTLEFADFFSVGQGDSSHITAGQRYYCSSVCGLWVFQ